jgi:hypothetical protein
LVLEITEMATVGDPKGALARLTELKWLHLGLALDDFGTGYSSLSYLRSADPDRSWVRLRAGIAGTRPAPIDQLAGSGAGRPD